MTQILISPTMVSNVRLHVEKMDYMRVDTGAIQKNHGIFVPSNIKRYQVFKMVSTPKQWEKSS